MTISKEQIKHISKLAKLKFNDEEAENFASEFEYILEQFKTLDKLQLDDIKIDKSNISVFRKDIEKKFKIDDLYRNTKAMRETAIEVPKIIE